MEKLETIRSTDHLLIENIASHLHIRILSVTEEAWRSNSQYNEIVERLMFMVRDQVEVVCRLNEMKERISLVTSAQNADERWGHLRDLSYTIDYLTLYLMGLFSDNGYSTWNILRLLDVNDFSVDKRLHPSLLEHVLSISTNPAEARQQYPEGFDIALSERGMSQQQVELVESLMGQVLYLAKKYKSLLASFYDPGLEPSSIIYLVHVVESVGAKILSSAILLGSMLQLIMIAPEYFPGNLE
jgi:hypothetical protein